MSISVTHDHNYALAKGSAKSGDLDTLKILVEQNLVDPKNQNDSELLRVAAENQHPDVVEYLIPLSDPKAMDSLALRWACEKTGIECVKLLLPHSDPTTSNSAALRLAVTYGNHEAAKLLFDLCDPQQALSDLLERPNLAYGRKNVPETFVRLWEEHQAQKLSATLHAHIQHDGAAALKRKM